MVKSLICKNKIECKISSEPIHKGEPYIKIYGFPIKKNKARKLSNILVDRGDQKEEFHFIGEEQNECKECRKYDYVKTLRICENSNEYKHSLCGKCRESLSREVIEIKEKLEENIHHWESFGICIFELGPLKMTKHEDIINNNISEGTIVAIALKSRFFVTKISNIFRLIRYIEKSNSNTMEILECHRCGEKKRDTEEINKNLDLCCECRLLIKNRLREYIENNKEFVVSRTI